VLDKTSDDYRACFGTDAGKRVLGHILIGAGYFDADLTTPEQQAVQNFAKSILKEITGVPPQSHTIISPDKVDGYVNGLYNLG
jgi:hypothetical protein